jgi:hypothetical protein
MTSALQWSVCDKPTMLDRKGIATRALRAAVGLRSEPPAVESLAVSLIENGWAETLGMGVWTVAWALTGALLLLTGRVVNSMDRPIRTQILIVAGMPMAISVVGFIIHMSRAAMALSEGRKLAMNNQPGGAYSRAVARLTATTPWVLLPQILIGVGLAAFLTLIAN